MQTCTIIDLGRASVVTASTFVGKVPEQNNPILLDYIG